MEISQAIVGFRKKSQQRQKKLRKTGKCLNLVLNNMDVGVQILDAPKQVVFSNPCSRKSLLLAHTNFSNRSILEIVRNPEVALGQDAFVLDRAIDVHIRSLRPKMAEQSHKIERVRGMGHRFKGVEEL